MKKNADLLLTANISSYSASLISVKGFFSTLPTVLIAMSILPKRCFASSNSFDRGGRRQVALERSRFRAGRTHRGGRLLGLRLRCGAVVVNRHGLRAVARQIPRDQAAEILCAACDQDDLLCERMSCHG